MHGISQLIASQVNRPHRRTVQGRIIARRLGELLVQPCAPRRPDAQIKQGEPTRTGHPAGVQDRARDPRLSVRVRDAGWLPHRRENRISRRLALPVDELRIGGTAPSPNCPSEGTRGSSASSASCQVSRGDVSRTGFDGDCFSRFLMVGGGLILVSERPAGRFRRPPGRARS